MLCLAYVYNVKKEMLTTSFTCLGCEENQPNQLEHDCNVIKWGISYINFEKALNEVCHENVVLMWRYIVIRSCVPPLALHNIMKGDKLRSVKYVKNNYILKIRKYLNKTEEAELKAFLWLWQMRRIHSLWIQHWALYMQIIFVVVQSFNNGT